MSNLSGPGVILVAAAGNEATDPIRAFGTITQGGSVTVGFNIPGNSKGGELEIWYPGTDSYGVNVAGPGCAATVTVNPGDTPGTVATPCGAVEFVSTGPQANNDDRQIKVSIGSTSAATLVTGRLEDHAGRHRRGRRQPRVLDHQRRRRHRVHVHRSHRAADHRDPDRHVEFPARDRRRVVQHAHDVDQRQRSELRHVGRRGVRHLELQQPRPAPQLQQPRQVSRRS